MNNNLFKPRFLLLAGMILAAAFTRLIPHYPNFTAVGAIALFGGAYFSKKYLAFLVPLAAMLLTDLILGFHSTMAAVYISFVLIVLIGMKLRENKKVSSIFLASISASVLFFILTNFAVWISSTMYPPNLAGLFESYLAALPFFSYDLLGNLFYVSILFGSFELMKIKFPVLAKINS